MFYKIIFSENVIKRRARWLLIRHTLLSGATGLGLWLVGYSFVLPDSTVYALSHEYADVYLDLLPRDIALSVGLPVTAEFVWAGSVRNHNHQAFLDSLSKDIQAMNSACSGRILYSSSDRVRHSEGKMDEDTFQQVDALFGAWATNPVPDPKSIELESAVKNDPLVKAYLSEEKTPLAVSGQEQTKFLTEQMHGFNNTLWSDESAILGKAFGSLKSRERSTIFQIDPQLTFDLLEAGTQPRYREKKAIWEKLSRRRFSFKRKMLTDLSGRVSLLRKLDSEMPRNQDVQPLFSQAEWLLNAATNFFTLEEIKTDKPKSRIVEIAKWASFSSPPVVTVGSLTNGKSLFSQNALQITMSDATPIPFRQYADFYKCLANEPERFQILSVSSLEVEIRDGAAYVKRFEISGEIVGVNPENLKTYLTKVDEAKHCFEDLRKVGAILAKGKPDRSSP